MITLYQVYRAGSIFLRVLDGAIFVYVILSWFRPSFRAYYWLTRFIEPFVSPFRKLSVKIMTRTKVPLDFSCWFAMIAIAILERLWARLFLLLL